MLRLMRLGFLKKAVIIFLVLTTGEGIAARDRDDLAVKTQQQIVQNHADQINQLDRAQDSTVRDLIQVGIYKNKPKVFIDDAGNPSGFFPELLQAIAKRENWELEYVNCAWDECLSQLETARLDLMVDVAYSPQREQRFDFHQEAVFNSRCFAYTTGELTVTSILDLDGKAVGVLDGSIQEDLLRDRAQKQGIEPIIVEFTSFDALFQALNTENIEIGLANEFIGERFTEQYQNVEQTNFLLNTSQLYFAVPEGQNTELLAAIDRHLVTLKDTPHSVYDELKHRWLLGEPHTLVNQTFLYQALAVTFAISTTLIIIVILIANRRLKQELIKRQEAETGLRKSDHEFKKLVANIPGALLRYVLYPDGSDKIPYMSPVCEKLWEVKASTVEESAAILWDMVHQEDITAMRESVMLSAATLQPWFFEWRITTPSGKQKWLQGRGNPREGKNASVIWESIMFDVTDQKALEQNLQETQNRLQQITDAVPGALYQYQIDRTGKEKFVFMSEGVQDLLGLTSEEVTADAGVIWARVDEATRSRLKLFIEYSAATLSVWQCEFQVTLPDGHKKWIKGQSVPQAVEDGILWNGILIDISQQKWQEQLLATQQEILEDLAEGEELSRILTQLIYLIEQRTENLIGSVLLLEEDRLVPCGESKLPPDYIEAINGLTIGEGVGSCGTAAYRCQPVISADLASDPLWENYRELAARHNIKACWSMPIVSSTETVLGVFALHSPTPRHPYHWEKELVTVAAKLAALAIERKQQESILQKQAEQERLLSRITQQIRQSLNLSTVLDDTVQEVRNFMGADRVLIYSLEQNQQGVIAESVGEGWISLINKKLTDSCLNNVGSGHILTQGKIQNIPDLAQAELDPCYRQMLADSQVQANLVVPIFQEDERWGFLIVQQCSQPRHWQENEINFLKQLTEQVAIAIQQAELYQQTQIELLQREKLAAQLRHQAMHDALTQLPNRSLLMDRLQHTFQVYQRHKTKGLAHFALLFLDLNRFKIINDTLGHEAGDQLLIAVAERLQNCLRGMDTVGRLGGDEFVVIVEEITGEREAIEVANRIHEAFAPPVYLNSQEVYISTSIGIVMDYPEYNYPEEMLRDADIAMYEAKKNQLRYVIFHPAMQANLANTVQLEADLREAIERQELVLYYQPIFHLGSGQIEGFEALIRWQHPTRGLMKPTDFISLAEQTGLITDIELWSFQEACSQLKQWQEVFSWLERATIHINISAQQFYQDNFIDQLKLKLDNIGLEAHLVKLEITEKILVDNKNLASQVLSKIEDWGVKVCLDDFGIGYSSLSYLSQFPIADMKLDPSLIMDVDQGITAKRNRQIIKGIHDLCRNLKISAIAEGVETQDQTIILSICGYHLAQGYYFCKPLSPQDMRKFLIAKGDRMQVTINN